MEECSPIWLYQAFIFQPWILDQASDNNDECTYGTCISLVWVGCLLSELLPHGVSCRRIKAIGESRGSQSLRKTRSRLASRGTYGSYNVKKKNFVNIVQRQLTMRPRVKLLPFLQSYLSCIGSISSVLKHNVEKGSSFPYINIPTPHG
jgi:hypothetical protein